MKPVVLCFLLFLSICAKCQELAFADISYNRLSKIPDIKNINTLDESVNTKFNEKLPVISPDGKTIFFERENDNFPSYGLGDIYFSTRDEKGSWSMAENIGKPLNNEGNNFISSILADGKTIVLGNTYKSDGSLLGIGVSISHKTPSGWSKPENLNIDNFSNKNKYGSFFLSNDQRILLMTIENKYTNGELDLYVSFKSANNIWTEPINLGPTINSKLSDTNPFLAPDGKTLYFASSGHPGLGGYDLFVSNRCDDSWTNWTKPVNAGSGINTAHHEMSFSLSATGRDGFYYGMKDKNKKCDIFYIDMVNTLNFKPCTQAELSINLFDDRTKKPIIGKVDFPGKTELAFSAPIITNFNNSDCKFIVNHDSLILFYAEAKGYLPAEAIINLKEMGSSCYIDKSMYLEPMLEGAIINLNNITFPQSTAELKETSIPSLERFALFLNKNPTLKIELRGHTDNQGDDEKNYSLSKERVIAVKNFLVEKGIDKNRVSIKAFGSKQPIANNITDEGRTINRRVEIKILKL